MIKELRNYGVAFVIVGLGFLIAAMIQEQPDEFFDAVVRLFEAILSPAALRKVAYVLLTAGVLLTVGATVLKVRSRIRRQAESAPENDAVS